MPLTRLPLTTGVSGTLAAGNGGTGVTSADEIGNLVLLSQASSTTAVSEIDLTASSLYDDYILNMTIIPATDNTNVWCRVLVGGTVQSASGDYAFGSIRTDGTVFGNSGNSNSATAMQLHNQYNAGSGGDEGLSFTMNMININSTNKAKDFHYSISMDNISNAHLGHIGTGRYNSNTNVISGFRIFMSSGNISKYDYRFYGLRK